MTRYTRFPSSALKRLTPLASLLGGLLIAGHANAFDPEQAPRGVAEGVTQGQEVAIFAGGCFWCMEGPFDKLDGVISTTSGYTAGETDNPTYKQVSAGRTGHTEAVKVVYDPEKVSYDTLLEVFWHNIDPVAVDRQFCDAGTQYRSGIYPVDEAQQDAAQASLDDLKERFPEGIATEIEAAGPWYAAEQYHQDFYQKNPVRYRFYRAGCGRDDRLEEIWGDDAPAH
ncbi:MULTISPECIES: peptide-methionine (S)-S-oxide reductase MsrA [Cobetia]|uniref:peptide-methionine (S)-S-oxide reductase MsrA n=1 Tax=Cobetia TaxID=204286 RepID=UPI0008658C4F|nr:MULTISPECIES: peptide-methionine (S)-S-oxide reductase MsrA [Cobetia]AOM00539.1 peptide-methionine (S)-S-oxide reductase [Cobetia marina]AZV30622.1 peptide-methionine (S)-S-oxide reductase [Cobetia sp. ICG0124]